MRPITLPPDPGRDADLQAQFNWLRACVREIESASNNTDVGQIADNYDISGSLTSTRTLNVSSPSTSNIAQVIGTFLDDLKSRGPAQSGL